METTGRQQAEVMEELCGRDARLQDVTIKASLVTVPGVRVSNQLLTSFIW